MRFYFKDKPQRMCAIAGDSRSDAPSTATPDAQSIVKALEVLGARILARWKPVLTTDQSGPRTLAEINLAAEKLWPKPKPLTPAWMEKSKGETKR